MSAAIPDAVTLPFWTSAKQSRGTGLGFLQGEWEVRRGVLTSWTPWRGVMLSCIIGVRGLRGRVWLGCERR